MAGSHSALDPASGPPGPPGVCAATSLHVEDDEDEEDEERPGDLLEMDAATAAAAAETRPTPGGALSSGRPVWFKKRGEVTKLGLPGAAPAAPSTRFPLPSRLVRGRVPPEARAWIVAKGLLLMRAGLSPELNPTIVLPALGFRPDKPIAEWLP